MEIHNDPLVRLTLRVYAVSCKMFMEKTGYVSVLIVSVLLYFQFTKICSVIIGRRRLLSVVWLYEKVNVPIPRIPAELPLA